MGKPRSKGRSIAKAQRGYIIQRVLVDGWTTRRAADSFNIEERRIARWVSDFRAHGMAALHHDEAEAEGACRRLWRRWASALHRGWAAWSPSRPRGEATNFVVLRRTGDEGRNHR